MKGFAPALQVAFAERELQCYKNLILSLAPLSAPLRYSHWSPCDGAHFERRGRARTFGGVRVFRRETALAVSGRKHSAP